VPVIACPQCGKSLKLPSDFAKPRARCPSCKHGIDVPRIGKPELQPESKPDLDLLLLENAAARDIWEALLPTDESLPTGEDLVPVVFEAPLCVAAVPPARRRSWRTLIGILAGLLSLAGCAAVAVWGIGLLRSATAELRNRQPEADPPIFLNEKQKAIAADAIKALARIEAAVQVGVNYPKYNDLVIDAKAAVNEADLHLPDCELLTALDDSMRAFSDAALTWDEKIRFKRADLTAKDLARYDIPDEYRTNADVAMQVMWQAAATKLMAARILQQRH
jgi:hypothetical protein